MQSELILQEHACGLDCLCWKLRHVPAIEEAVAKGILYASAPTFPAQGSSLYEIMARVNDRPKNIGELIDRIDQIREELLAIQSAMEKMERPETVPPRDGNKKH
jgi:hypothetical protein